MGVLACVVLVRDSSVCKRPVSILLCVKELGVYSRGQGMVFLINEGSILSCLSVLTVFVALECWFSLSMLKILL